MNAAHVNSLRMKCKMEADILFVGEFDGTVE